MKLRLFAAGMATLLLCIPLGLAQEADEEGTDTQEAALEAVITGPTDIAVGRTIVLDASLSRSAREGVEYRWYINDNPQPISQTVEAVYTPETTGVLVFRLVLSLPAEEGEESMTSEALHTVTVYNRKIVLIADTSVTADRIERHQETATENGVFLRVLQPAPSATPLGAEEALTALINEQASALLGADTIVVWTEGITGLQALMRSAQANLELAAGLHNQTIVVVASRSLQTLARTVRGTYGVLQPQQILLTRREAITPLLTSENVDRFLAEIDQYDIDYQRIDASTAGLRPWNLLSSLVNAMLARGVPSQTVILLLVLPVIAMILAFLKQVVGITTFGLYTPSIIALSFLALGWQVGVFFLLFIILTGYATRSLMRRWRLLYIPKVAIILTVVSFTLLLLMGISAYWGVTFSRETIFILLIMSTLAESFLNLKTEQGWTSALLGIGETIVASLVCVFIVQWAVFQSIILAYPELLILTVVADAMLGRWTGLRLMEYVRFREVFKHLQEE